jgi:2-succinyl-5-enolpyruvyl-6-hydroxy-3-cyclohexene-1-carboxylate synthase
VVTGFVADAARRGAELVVVEPFGRWPDPDRLATAVVRAEPTAACRAWADPARGPGTPGAWWDGWVAAEAAARSALADTVDGRPLDEPTVARVVHAALPAAATLVVSSSMPVRDLEAFALPRPDGPRILANRGANGIDGVVSTALGVAVAGGGPVVALVGDLAFLHDLGALVSAAGSPIALTVVVVDNGGGGIFSFLEQADAFGAETFDLLFGTPQAPDVAAAAAGLGWDVDDLAASDGSHALVAALARRVGGDAPGVIRIRVPDRGANVAVHRELQAAVVTAVDAAAGSAPAVRAGTGAQAPAGTHDP